MNGEGESQGKGLREIGESAVEGLLDRVGRGVSKVQERRPLAYDVLESDDAYLVVFDAPGATNSDVQVQFRDEAVEVKVDRFREFHEEFEMRFPGRGLSLDGTAELPEGAGVDPTAADATLAENGTLQVHVPKTESDSTVDVDDEDEADDGPESIELDEHDADEPTDHDEQDEHADEPGDHEGSHDGEEHDTHDEHGGEEHDAHADDDHDAHADDDPDSTEI